MTECEIKVSGVPCKEHLLDSIYFPVEFYHRWMTNIPNDTKLFGAMHLAMTSDGEWSESGLWILGTLYTAYPGKFMSFVQKLHEEGIRGDEIALCMY